MAAEAFTLVDFVRESNMIEGIYREPTKEEIQAHEQLFSQQITVESLREFVRTIAPGCDLRDGPGMDVVIGNHRPPYGGPLIPCLLSDLISDLYGLSAYEAHHRYERLHPFMDGNGRSGRALWLMLMGGIAKVPLGFLHTWYYQSLDYGR